jgi:hypothetical protein
MFSYLFEQADDEWRRVADLAEQLPALGSTTSRPPRPDDVAVGIREDDDLLEGGVDRAGRAGRDVDGERPQEVLVGGRVDRELDRLVGAHPVASVSVKTEIATAPPPRSRPC